MDDLKPKPFPPLEQPPKVDPAYFQKIDEEMKVLAEKIPVVAKQPSNKKIWCKIGDLWFGHPVTPLILRYRALIWLRENPPDPRGQKFASRPGPYVVYVCIDDMALAINRSTHTVDRMLHEVRKSIDVKPYKSITVEVFCRLCNLPEDEIQQKLNDIFMKRWNKHKKKRKDEDD